MSELIHQTEATGACVITQRRRSDRRPARRRLGGVIRHAVIVAMIVAPAVLTACVPLSPEQIEVLGLMNADRATANVEPVTLHPGLTARADQRAVMLRDRWVSAGCPTDNFDLTPGSRDIEADYDVDAHVPNWFMLAENLTAQPDILVLPGMSHARYDYDEVMSTDFARRNVLGVGPRKVGLGFAYGPTQAQSDAGFCPNRRPNELLWHTQIIVK